MTEFLFMRHGATDANTNGLIAGRTDDPLNEIGFRQARAAAKELEGLKLDAVFCGNRKRVRQTFETVRDSLVFDEKNLFFTDEIREMDFGDWEGMDYKRISTDFPEEWAAYMDDWTRFTFPNGEVIRKYFDCCGTFILDAAARHEGEKVAVFGHQGFILSCACVLDGKPLDRLFDRKIENGAYFFAKWGE